MTTMYIRENEDGTTETFFDRPGDGPVAAGVRWAEMPRALSMDGSEAWDWDAEAIVPRLDVLRARAWAAVKTRRDIEEQRGCETPLGRADTDTDSQRKVAGAVQMALIAAGAQQPFAVDWTMQDNSSVTHDAPAMIALGVAVGQHVAACHEAALIKRAAIESAEDPESIAAVDIETGWPGA